MATLSMATMVPSASLSLVTGSRTKPTCVSVKVAGNFSSSSGLLQCSFVAPSSSLSFSSNSAFSGLSLCWDSTSGAAGNIQKRRGLVVRAKKYALCQTKRNRSRKSLARTHGFRKRMSTTSGRAVLQRRRAKGRWNLCPKTNPNSGKRA